MSETVGYVPEQDETEHRPENSKLIRHATYGAWPWHTPPITPKLLTRSQR